MGIGHATGLILYLPFIMFVFLMALGSDYNILAAAFYVLTLAGGASGQEVGTGIAVGILMDTFLVRTLLIPSTVVLLEQWNWWPTRLTLACP